MTRKIQLVRRKHVLNLPVHYIVQLALQSTGQYPSKRSIRRQLGRLKELFK